MGLSKPVHVLQRGAEVNDIVNVAAIAVVEARENDALHAANALTSVQASRCASDAANVGRACSHWRCRPLSSSVFARSTSSRIHCASVMKSLGQSG